MRPRVTFETPEDVGLSFEIAGPGSRVAAGLIDMLFIAILIVSVLGVLVAAEAIAFSMRDLITGDLFTELSGVALMIVLGVVSSINLGYFLVFERWLDGQSPGKRMVGLRVVADGGYALGFGASLIRNIARLVDMLPGPYLVGFFSVVLSSRGQRLGDLMAGTIVVRHRRTTLPERHFAGERYANLPNKSAVLGRSELARLNEGSLALLDNYFDRVRNMDTSAATALSATLAHQLAETMDLAPPEQPETFLREVYLALRERSEGV